MNFTEIKNIISLLRELAFSIEKMESLSQKIPSDIVDFIVQNVKKIATMENNIQCLVE